MTTSDGSSDPVVWMVGAEGDNRLHGFKGDTGEPLLPAGAGPAMEGLRHFQTLIATRDRLYVGADGRIYALRSDRRDPWAHMRLSPRVIA